MPKVEREVVRRNRDGDISCTQESDRVVARKGQTVRGGKAVRVLFMYRADKMSEG